MKATTSRLRIHKSSPKYSDESTRCSRVSPKKCRRPGLRGRSAAPARVFPQELILAQIRDLGIAKYRFSGRVAGCFGRATPRDHPGLILGCFLDMIDHDHVHRRLGRYQL